MCRRTCNTALVGVAFAIGVLAGVLFPAGFIVLFLAAIVFLIGCTLFR